MAAVHAFHLPASACGQRLCVYHAPAGDARSVVVYLHPFAEEMNKSRRMAAMQARCLADHGHAVLQIDLAGCGDSGGEFADATWALWLDDAALAAAWLRARHRAPLWWWGLRAGALLAAAAAAVDTAGRDAQRLLLWQPVLQGKAHLQQFLRTKAASQMQDGRAADVMRQLRKDLESGRSVEVAGYELPPAIASGLESASLGPDAGLRGGVLEWIDVASGEDLEPGPATAAALQRWRDAGWATGHATVRGPSFWQTVEIEDAPELLPATLAALQRHAAP